MNFKAFLATVAVAATTLVAPAAQAVQQDRIGYNEPGAYELYEALRKTGVTIDIMTCEDDKAYGWYNGGYNNGDGGMVICDNVATTYADQWETLRHEAVHAAQHCRDWDTVMKPQWLKENLTRADYEFVTSDYPKHAWAIEFEAFALEHHSNYDIAHLVNTTCAPYQM